MRHKKLIVTALLFLNIFSCKSRNDDVSDSKSIFGSDDRKDLFEIKDKKKRELASSVGILIKSSSMNLCGPFICDLLLFKEAFLTQAAEMKNSSKKPLCAGEKFSNQPFLGFCSAFLIGKNIIATAGHCLEETPFDTFHVIFNVSYNAQDSIGKDFIVKKQQIYKPIKVLEDKYSEGKDFALILLDRPVNDMSPSGLTHLNLVD